MRKSQVRGSKDGTEPACSTGHLSVRDWPGGRRPAARISRSWARRSFDESKSMAKVYRATSFSAPQTQPSWGIVRAERRALECPGCAQGQGRELHSGQKTRAET